VILNLTEKYVFQVGQKLKNTTIKNKGVYLYMYLPYLGLHNAQDFAQILYFVEGCAL
jgi:hypothetical protein